MNKKSEKVKTQTWNESFAAFGETEVEGWREEKKAKSRWKIKQDEKEL